MSGESGNGFRRIFKGLVICALEFLVPILLISMALSHHARAQESTPCCDFLLGLPVPREGDQARSRFLRRDTAAFYLNAFVPHGTPLTWSDENHVQLPIGVLPLDVHQIFRDSLDENGILSPNEFRDSIASPYLRERAHRHGELVIPEELSALLATHNFLNWRRIVVAISGVKGRTRALYYSPPEVIPRIAVAQTHESTTGDLSSAVRETELIVERLNEADQWDFYAYDSMGHVSTQSEFRSGHRAAPAVCLGCHYNSSTRTFAPRGPGFEN